MLKPKIYVKSKRKTYNVDYINFIDNIFGVTEDDGFCEEYYFNETFLMDNTGFKDKHGANIYTGDIVEYTRRHPDVGTLRGVICKNEYGAYVIELYVIKDPWDNKIDKMLGSKVEYEKPNLSFLLDNTTHDGCVVLGNIYENKELLEC